MLRGSEALNNSYRKLVVQSAKELSHQSQFQCQFFANVSARYHVLVYKKKVCVEIYVRCFQDLTTPQQPSPHNSDINSRQPLFDEH